MNAQSPFILIYDVQDMTFGNTRILANGIYQDLMHLGFNVDYGIKENIANYDIVIYGKNFKNTLRNDHTSKIKGLIQPSDANQQLLSYSLLADFWIVGSYEEQDYYLKYKQNVIIFPLIERYRFEKKKHEEKKNIIIGYHGNRQHLENFSPDLRAALEEIAHKRDIRLRAVYNIAATGMWEKARPRIEIEDVQWTLETLPSQILSMDIGLVPLLTHIPKPCAAAFKKIATLIRPEAGANAQNYLLQFKNNTNPGRCFVFQQFGIPVAAELSPAAFAAIPNEQYGYIAYGKDGWFRALDQLCSSADLRATIADNAYNFFSTVWNNKYYLPAVVSMIENLYNHRSR